MENQRGFTLIELIMVMVIVGILAVFAAPKFFEANVFQSRGAADQVKAALRYAQKIAIAQRTTVSVVISSAAVADCSTALVGGNVACVVSNKVAIPGKTVTFNALGQPVPNAADAIVVGAAPNDTTIAIEAETGYVH
ncbi:MAG: hypothetical protein A2061_07985 [Gallionellales bacterium GWA2_59_43]|nr:MAG: hypothetical protein A2061_07985 [Gallionellales bacterium GWA2_59_43]